MNHPIVVSENDAMNCENALPLLHAAVDGVISENDRADLDAHVGRCAACAARRGELSRLDAAFAADRLALPKPPAGLNARIAATIAAAPAPAPAGRLVAFMRMARPLATAAAILLVAGAAFVMGRQTTQAGDSSVAVEIEKWRADAAAQGADAAAVDRLLRDYMSEKETIDGDSQKRYDEAYERLDRGVKALIGKGREASSEPKSK